jgi:hypothetical protein
MQTRKDIQWFNDQIAPTLRGFEISYKSFKNGDLGDIERVEFDGKDMGGSIDFWSSGWLGIHAYNYKEEKLLLNILLEPKEDKEQEKAFEKLRGLLL